MKQTTASNTLYRMSHPAFKAMGVRVMPNINPIVYTKGLFIERESMLTGIKRTRFIEGAHCIGLDRWRNGEGIWEALPDVNGLDREFISTGTLPYEWDNEFNDDNGNDGPLYGDSEGATIV